MIVSGRLELAIDRAIPIVGKPREQKYFSMEERNSAGMDNYWHVGKGKKDFT